MGTRFRALPLILLVSALLAMACGQSDPYATRILPVGIPVEEARSIHQLSSYMFGEAQWDEQSPCYHPENAHLIEQWDDWREAFKTEHPDLYGDSADLVRPDAPDTAKIWVWDTAMGVHKAVCPGAFEAMRIELATCVQQGCSWGKDYVLQDD